MRIPPQRELFDIPNDVTYFNCAYMSPLLRAAHAAGVAGMGRKSRPWEIASTDFFTHANKARDSFAALLNADAEGVALIPAASYGLSLAANNLSLEAGQDVLLLAEQFPSNVYSWRELAKAHGGQVKTVARPLDNDWTATVCAQIDDRTRIATLPHCHWTDGSLIDLVAVRQRCDSTGTALVLDVTQSLGAMPFDAQAVRPDFLICAAYKWLLGPYSMGFLYAAPDRRDGQPLEHSWIARAGSEDFSALVDYRDDYQPGAQRYDVGERANFALLPAAIAALEQLLAWGVDNIYDTLSAMTDDIVERVRPLGLTAAPRNTRAGHFLGLRFAGGAPPTALLDQLASANVYVSIRGDAMRVTPHVYNTPRDVDRLVEVLANTL